MSQQTIEKSNTATRRMSSIVRRLHWSWIGKKAGLYIGADFLMFVLLSLGYIYDQEITRLSAFVLENHRGMHWQGTLHSLLYRVTGVDGDLLLEIEVYPALCVIGTVLFVIAIFQIMDIIFSYKKEEKRIRYILRPIDEIALKADELSKMTFNEDKYQQIEDVITNFQDSDNALLSFGDSDLQGIEAAMNNLLLRMRDSYRQQARFVNDASHELRTPIAVIQGYANMLARWGREDEKVLDESIDAISHESEHMKHLVEQLLFLARGDSGKTKLTMEPVSIQNMMQEVYEESFMIDEEHPYRLHPSEEEIVITADAMMLKQAVRILVDNAAKYTNKGDEIILSYGKNEDGHSYLQVQDTGIGMAEADVKHMFERFYRADDARSYQGTGLGLAIAKWIIDKHQGHFEILSRTELGTRIRIVL